MSGNTYSFADATGSWIAAVNAEGKGGFAGPNDWRIPTATELASTATHYDAQFVYCVDFQVEGGGSLSDEVDICDIFPTLLMPVRAARNHA